MAADFFSKVKKPKPATAPMDLYRDYGQTAEKLQAKQPKPAPRRTMIPTPMGGVPALSPQELKAGGDKVAKTARNFKKQVGELGSSFGDLSAIGADAQNIIAARSGAPSNRKDLDASHTRLKDKKRAQRALPAAELTGMGIGLPMLGMAAPAVMPYVGAGFGIQGGVGFGKRLTGHAKSIEEEPLSALFELSMALGGLHSIPHLKAPRLPVRGEPVDLTMPDVEAAQRRNIVPASEPPRFKPPMSETEPVVEPVKVRSTKKGSRASANVVEPPKHPAEMSPAELQAWNAAQESGKPRTVKKGARSQTAKPAPAPTPGVDAPTPYDVMASGGDWRQAMADAIKASKESGATHLDQVPHYVETLRGRRVKEIGNGKEWVVTNVDNNGMIYAVSPDGAGTELIYQPEDYVLQPTQPGDVKVMRDHQKSVRDELHPPKARRTAPVVEQAPEPTANLNMEPNPPLTQAAVEQGATGAPVEKPTEVKANVGDRVRDPALGVRGEVVGEGTMARQPVYRVRLDNGEETVWFKNDPTGFEPDASTNGAGILTDAEKARELRRAGAGMAPKVEDTTAPVADPAPAPAPVDDAPYQWPYEEYSDWSRQMAKNYTRAELEKRLGKAEGAKQGALDSHLRAVEGTHSMTGNSQRRAQSRNVVTANYEERQALKNALEIHDFYPEQAKTNAPTPADTLRRRPPAEPLIRDITDTDINATVHKMLAGMSTDEAGVNVATEHQPGGAYGAYDSPLLDSQKGNIRVNTAYGEQQAGKSLLHELYHHVAETMADPAALDGAEAAMSQWLGTPEGQRWADGSGYHAEELQTEALAHLATEHLSGRPFPPSLPARVIQWVMQIVDRMRGISRELASRPDVLEGVPREARRFLQDVASGKVAKQWRSEGGTFDGGGLMVNGRPVEMPTGEPSPSMLRRMTPEQLREYHMKAIRERLAEGGKVYEGWERDFPEIAAEHAAAKGPETPAVKQPWQMMRDDYAWSVGTPKPELDLLSDSSGYQRSQMSDRAKSEMLNQRSQQRREATAKYNDSVKVWEQSIAKAVVSGEIDLAKAFDTDTFDHVTDIAQKLGFDTESNFRIRQKTEAQKDEYFQRLQAFLANQSEEGIAQATAPLETWQKTAKDHWREKFPDTGYGLSRNSSEEASIARENHLRTHSDAVTQALADGKTPYAGWGKDYPKLAEEYANPPKPVEVPRAEATRPVQADETPNVPVEAPKPPQTTAIKNEELDARRVELGLQELEPSERRTWQDAYDTAKAKGYDKDAEQIVARGDGLSDAEAAGVALRLAEMDNQIAANPTDTALQAQFDEFSKALKRTKAETARGLNAFKMAVNRDDMTLAQVRQQAAENRGRALKPAEEAAISEKVTELDRLKAETAKAEAADAEFAAEKAIRKEVIRKQSGVRKAAILRERDEIKAKLSEVFGRANAGLDPEAAYQVGRLALNYAKEGAATLDEAVRLVLADFPKLTRQDIVDGINQPNPDANAKVQTDAMRRVKSVKTEAQLTQEVADAMQGIFHDPDAKGPRTAASENIQKLRAQLNELRGVVKQTRQPKNVLAQKMKIIRELEEHLSAGTRPPKKGQAPVAPDVEAANKTISDLRRLMKSEDTLKDLQNQIATKNPRTPPVRQGPEPGGPLEANQIAIRKARRAIREMVGEKNASPLAKGYDTFNNTLRSGKATADLSSTLRQGLILVARDLSRDPKGLGRKFGKSIAATFSKYSDEQIHNAIMTDPRFPVAERSGLHISEMEGNAAQGEELFAGGVAENLPWLGEVVKGSERHMRTFLNLMRTDAFNKFMDAYPDASTAELKAMADVINVFSGRGNLGRLGAISKPLGRVFFAPRFAVSRVEAAYKPLQYRDMPRVQAEATKSLAATAAFGGTLLGLAKLSGAEVSGDPNSPDFGRIRVGNTRFDVFGGMQPPARLALKAFFNVGGRLGLPVPTAKDYDPISDVTRNVSYKLAPGVTFPLEMAMGKDIIGQKKTPQETLKGASVPMILSDTVDAYKDGGLGRGAAALGAGALGVGASTYAPKTKKTKPGSRASRRR